MESIGPGTAPGFAEAFRFWLKLGFLSFGGPAGQIALMHEELVGRRRWIAEDRFMHALNYCMLLPGPEAQQLATYIGWLLHGTPGAIAAGTLFVLPSLVILILLSWAYMAVGQQPVPAAILYGIKPAVIAIVVFAAWRIGSRALVRRGHLVIAAAAFLAITAVAVPFPWIALTAALAGWALDRNSIGKRPEHPAAPRRILRRALAVMAGFAILLAVLVAAIVALDGTDGLLTRMARFFTGAAFLTFGGAYAVLPYVHQAAVTRYGWLTSTQMLDGLALGETTPGPLIMVVAFVGFVGGWTHGAAGLTDPLVAGIAGAVTATIFTFLPSFLFILAGAPLVEATRGDTRFSAPLGGITAAVVGVIVSLAVVFSRHVFWPEGFGAGVDIVAVTLCTVAFLLLYQYKVRVIPVIGLAAAAGLLIRLTG